MKRSKLERETTICFNEAENRASIWSASKQIKKHLGIIGIKPEKIQGEGAWFYVPKSWVRVKPPKKMPLGYRPKNAFTAKTTEVSS